MREGVQVLNLSFAGGADPIVDKLVQAAIQKGIIVVASAGNGGPGAQPAYPAALPGVIAVTAVDKGESVFKRANRGDYIDLSAPGVGILTTAPRGAYQVSSGTSLATATTLNDDTADAALADLTVWASDPVEASPDELPGVAIVMTVVDGRIVHEQ